MMELCLQLKKEGEGMGELARMVNLGKVIEEQLYQVNINTPDQLREAGSKKAWLKIQQIDESACINRLYALEAAIRNVKKKELDMDVKIDLKAFYQTHKKNG